MGTRLILSSSLLFVVVLATVAASGLRSSGESLASPYRLADGDGYEPQDVTDVLGANAACLVCHVSFLKEPLVRTHQLKGVACIKCHGASEKHANDEHIGATKPDITYARNEVDPSCHKCHERHDVPASNIVARFLERKLPADPAPVCTSCHGMHKIDQPH